MPEDLWKRLDSCAVDPTLKDDAGTFLLLDARDASAVYSIPPAKRRVRTNRGRLRRLLMEGLDVRFGKKFVAYEVAPDGNSVTAMFEDGSTLEAAVLVGVDGNHSRVRRQLVGTQAAELFHVPVRMDGLIQRMSAKDMEPVRALNPLLFQAINPDTKFYLWHSVQNVVLDQNGTIEAYDILTIVSHMESPDDPPRDAPAAVRIADMKRRVQGCSEPFLSIVNGIPDDSQLASLSLGDWIPIPYETHGRVVIAGDATGPMTMYRGEGANHGLLDAALLADTLFQLDGDFSTERMRVAFKVYQDEVRRRRERAIPLSRQACLDAHLGRMPGPESPLVGARSAPEIAGRRLFVSERREMEEKVSHRTLFMRSFAFGENLFQH